MRNKEYSILVRLLAPSILVNSLAYFLRLWLPNFIKMIKLRFYIARARSVIEFPFKVSYIENVHVGPHVQIRDNVNFSLSQKCHVYIGEGTYIGSFCFISGFDNFIWIGKNVLIADQVFITESNHGYEDVTRPISKQGDVSKGSVRIEDDCWIGMGACILPNVTIGKHSVIGANAVVTHDIPPYSVAVGNPAKVIKKYDFESKQWVRINSSS